MKNWSLLPNSPKSWVQRPKSKNKVDSRLTTQEVQPETELSKLIITICQMSRFDPIHPGSKPWLFCYISISNYFTSYAIILLSKNVGIINKFLLLTYSMSAEFILDSVVFRSSIIWPDGVIKDVFPLQSDII